MKLSCQGSKARKGGCHCGWCRSYWKWKTNIGKNYPEVQQHFAPFTSRIDFVKKDSRFSAIKFNSCRYILSAPDTRWGVFDLSLLKTEPEVVSVQAVEAETDIIYSLSLTNFICNEKQIFFLMRFDVKPTSSPSPWVALSVELGMLVPILPKMVYVFDNLLASYPAKAEAG